MAPIETSLINQSTACTAARRARTPSWKTEPARSTKGRIDLDRVLAADDVRGALVELASTLQAAVLAPHVVRMRRLVAAESDCFPEAAASYLANSWTSNIAALSDTIAELAAQGHVHVADPWLAAHQFTWTAAGAALNAHTITGSQETVPAGTIHSTR